MNIFLYAIRSIIFLILLPTMLHLVATNISLSFHIASEPIEPIKNNRQQKTNDFNVLFITIDTCRADKLSCYGFDKVTSPNMDELAKNGYIFDFAFSASNWTRPATASIFTSVYPGTHQTNRLAKKISNSFRCLPERFKNGGYHTAVFSANVNISPDFGFDQGVDFFYETTQSFSLHLSILYRSLSHFSSFAANRLFKFNQRKMYADDMTEEDAIYSSFMQWLQNIKYEKFFAYIHLNTPHSAYDPPPGYDIFAEDPGIWVGRMEPEETLSEKKLQRLLSLYYGEILYVDFVVGNIIETFRELELLDKTIIVITADHGEEFYDHKAWGHRHSLYNELLHVPMIFYIPQYPYAPRRIRNIVSIIDIGPTLLALVGLPGDAFMDGKNLTPLFQGSSEKIRTSALAQQIKRDGIRSTIIGDGYKYIQLDSPSGKIELLFNMDEDFKEKNRLGLDTAPHYQNLKRELAQINQYTLSKKIDAPEITLSHQKKEELKALGYLE